MDDKYIIKRLNTLDSELTDANFDDFYRNTIKLSKEFIASQQQEIALMGKEYKQEHDLRSSLEQEIEQLTEGKKLSDDMMVKFQRKSSEYAKQLVEIKKNNSEEGTSYFCNDCIENEPCKLIVPKASQKPVSCPYGFRTKENIDQSSWTDKALEED